MRPPLGRIADLNRQAVVHPAPGRDASVIGRRRKEFANQSHGHPRHTQQARDRFPLGGVRFHLAQGGIDWRQRGTIVTADACVVQARRQCLDEVGIVKQDAGGPAWTAQAEERTQDWAEERTAHRFDQHLQNGIRCRALVLGVRMANPLGVLFLHPDDIGPVGRAIRGHDPERRAPHGTQPHRVALA